MSRCERCSGRSASRFDATPSDRRVTHGKNPTLETVDIGRRRLLTTTATGIAVAGAASLLPTNSAFAAKRDDIRPFKVQVPEEQLVDLRRRLAATRWSDNETVADHSQGAQQRLPRTGGDADVHGTWPRQNKSRGRGPQLAQYRSRQIRDMQHPVPSATVVGGARGPAGTTRPSWISLVTRLGAAFVGLASAYPRTHLATSRSHSFAGQLAGLLHPTGELSFVELVVLVDVENES